MKKLLSMLLMTIMMVACSEEDPKEIYLEKGTSTEQTIYADETSSAESISFVANESWKAVVNDISATRSAGKADWIELSQYEGGAGSFTLTLNVQPNKTGADRKAEIVITCGATQIKILVEQKSTTAGGDELIPVPSPSLKQISEIVSYSKNKNGEYEDITKVTFDYDEKGRIINQHQEFTKDESSDDPEEAKSWDYKLSYTKDAEGNDIIRSDCKVVCFSGKNWIYTETLTLDASGKAVKWKDEAVNGNKADTYLFYYNDKNQHIRTERKDISGDSHDNYSIYATWGLGSELLIGGEIPALSSKAEIFYNESILNDTSLDLAFVNITNSNLYRLRGDGFVMQNLNVWGTRIKNMPSKIVDKQKNNQDETYIFEYQLDNDNRIVSYTIKYGSEEGKIDIKYIRE